MGSLMSKSAFLRAGVILLASIVLFSVAKGDNGRREAVQEDLILMQGKWKLEDFVYYRDGKADRLPKAQRRGLRVVSGNRYRPILQIGAQKVDANYSFHLYPNQNPKAFDVTLPDGREIKGIYEISTDTLRRCYCQPGVARPTQFQSGDQTYQVWKRVDGPPATANKEQK